MNEDAFSCSVAPQLMVSECTRLGATGMLVAALLTLGTAIAQDLPGTKLLEPAEDRSEQLIAGIDRYLDRATEESLDKRETLWKRDLSSPEAYEKSVNPNRGRLRTILGAVDPLTKPVELAFVSSPDKPAMVAESETIRIFEVRWRVFEGVYGEGLWLQPKNPAIARIVALPDADQTPEMLAGLSPTPLPNMDFAKRLADAGCEVLVPTVIDRQCTMSGNPAIVMTDEPHREWIWRQAYELGRHIIGFEVRKVEAAIDWWQSQPGSDKDLPIGIAGFGEGGLIAFNAAALDTRIHAALVSGYFQPREALWSEPIYRNTWSLLREFGDAEIASLTAPRTLIIESADGPRLGQPPPDASRKKTAAPGSLQAAEVGAVRSEIDRARRLCRDIGKIEWISGARGPSSNETLNSLMRSLGLGNMEFKPSPLTVSSSRTTPITRQNRQVTELTEHCQRLLRQSEQTRAEYWKAAVPKSADQWPEATRPLKQLLWNDVLGRLPDPSLPANPKARVLEQKPAYTMWEVTLDVWPDVSAWGYLLVPNDIRNGERRPVVVCQHGLEGLPDSVINDDEKSRDWAAYRTFARRLAERGFICFCPHNPYRGAFRPLQRKAHPLGLSLFSFILGMHQRELEWLGSLPFVDSKRIGFYGLSYGGVSALRLPALLDGYALSICSAAFNDWPRKIVSNEFRSSYLFTAEHDHFSFNLANTFSNAELAALIAPRPFMVERGHQDGVAPDEWVAHEYAKVRRLYAQLGIPERTEIEWFMGRHEIHGQRTFEFLHQHLNWPK